ncbi:MAG: hypothetical protein H6672_02025 [Anaerolineaceae bacterium]|nr:hypothetical protein [Anaerolineaceae bacterium]
MTLDENSQDETGINLGFDYQVTKDERVFIYWYNKLVTTLAGEKAKKFLRQINGLADDDEQLVMARFTGNFKRGNERK